MSAVPFDAAPSATSTAPSSGATSASSPAPAATPVVTPPSAGELLSALGGFAVLGLCAGLGSGDTAVAVRTIPSGLLSGGGALLLTGPALVVAHQFLGLGGRPEALVAALGRGFTTSGRVALGLAPAMLFASATSGLWGVVLAALLGGAAVLGFAQAARRLVEAEGGTSALGTVTMTGLVGAWIGLTSLIGLRLAWDVAGFVVGR